MSIKRLPMTFLLVGLAFKTLLVLLWKFWQVPGLLNLLIYYDQGAFYFAEKMAGLFFDQRRIAPTPAESALFEIFLIIGFGIECFFFGFILQWLLRRFYRRRLPTAPTDS